MGGSYQSYTHGIHAGPKSFSVDSRETAWKDCAAAVASPPSFLTPVGSGVTVPSPGKLTCRLFYLKARRETRQFLSILPDQSQWFLESWDWHLLFKNKQTKSVRLSPSSLIKVLFPPDLFPIKGSYEKHFGSKAPCAWEADPDSSPKLVKCYSFFDWSLSFCLPLLSYQTKNTSGFHCPLRNLNLSPHPMKASPLSSRPGLVLSSRATLLCHVLPRLAGLLLFPLCSLLHRGNGTPQL